MPPDKHKIIEMYRSQLSAERALIAQLDECIKNTRLRTRLSLARAMLDDIECYCLQPEFIELDDEKWVRRRLREVEQHMLAAAAMRIAIANATKTSSPSS